MTWVLDQYLNNCWIPFFLKFHFMYSFSIVVIENLYIQTSLMVALSLLRVKEGGPIYKSEVDIRYAVGDLSKEIHGIYWDIHKTEDTKQNSLVVGTALLAIFLSQRGSLLRHSSRQSVNQTWGHGGGTKASRTLLNVVLETAQLQE